MHKMARLWCLTFVGSVALVGCQEDRSSGPGTNGDDAGIQGGPAGAGGGGNGGETTSGAGGAQGGSTGESMPLDAGADRPVDGQGDADAAKGGTTGTINSIGSIAVGDPVQPTTTSPSTKAGTVASIAPARGSYFNVVVTFPPEWTCPANPLLGTTPSATNTSTDPMLSGTTCEGLAALRTAGLKAQAYASLVAKHDTLARGKCNPTTETRCVDSQGQQVNNSNCSYYSGYVDASARASGGASTTPTTGAAGASGGAKDYSTTNNQVVDVDEADFVKNDANTIFVLGSDGLHIIDAWPAAETHQLATVKLTGEPRRLFLNGNRLVVYTRTTTADSKAGAGTTNPSDQGCTYGYGCRFSSEGGHTTATVFDVTDPSKPQELMRYQMSGGYVASRRIGSTVYTVVADTGAPQVPGLDYTISAGSYDELATVLAKKKAANDALIEGADQAYFLPWFRHVTPDGQTVVDTSCNHALATAGAQGTSFVSLLAFDLSKLEPMTRTLLGSSAGYVYASATSLYLAVDQTPEVDYSSTTSYGSYTRATNTAVHKFALAGTDTRYASSVTLSGHILNQFAMDEADGVLRVASTLGWVPDKNVSSYLTTFGEKDGKLVKLGEISKIAPGEDIRSVRFDGKRGFVVTFKKTDPLFVFDLSDANTPKLMGELKIPGFSTYMHPLDEGHILAVGFDADDQGSFAYFNGIQIQVFDVTDLADPKLQSKLSVGTRGSGSEALTNHLAFNYFPSKKMLAMPLTICEGGGDGTAGTTLTFTGLMVFDISLDTGIKEHGRLPFVDPAKAGTSASCQTWWTNTTSLVKRSIFMDDWVYGISDTQMKVASLDALSTPLQTVSLTGL
jgi:uncharacterized secreted protein with C-terminal beta-propeller domain